MLVVAVFRFKSRASQNQAVWIEIYTNRNLPAGIYRGQINVNADGQKQTIPIELELFDFTLPDQNSMHAMVYYESLQPVIIRAATLMPQYHRFAHRQRIELVHAYNISYSQQQRWVVLTVRISRKHAVMKDQAKASETRSSRAPSTDQAKTSTNVPMPGARPIAG